MIIIKTASDIQDRLLAGKHKLFPGKESIVLTIQELDTTALTSWQTRLNKLYHECGCSLGATFLLAALAIYLFFAIPTPHFSFALFLGKLILGIIIVFISGTAGKFLGVGIARIRFKTACKHLLNQLHHT